MNTLVKPIKKLRRDGDVANNWLQWKKKFRYYHEAVGGENLPASRQVALLINLMGRDADEIYENFQFAEGELRDLPTVLRKFDAYFLPKRNLTYERHVFFTCSQIEGQSFDLYLAELRRKSENCEFGTMKDDLIKDRIVCGIRNGALRQRLLREHDLTLTQAIDTCRTAEITEKRLEKFPGPEKFPGEAAQVQEVRYSTKRQQHKGSGTDQWRFNCDRCGTKHERRACPAYGQQCKNCNGNNHFARVCRAKKNKKVREVQHKTSSSSSSSSSSGDEMVVAEIKSSEVCTPGVDVSDFGEQDVCVQSISHNRCEKEWTAKVEVMNAHFVNFKLDTGAQTNLISSKLFERLKISYKNLLKSNVRLLNYLGEKIPFLGKCYLKCTYNGKVSVLEFYVVENVKSSPILGLSACIMLDLIRKVESVEVSPQNSALVQLVCKYPQCFKGIGALPGTYNMVLKDDVKPVVHAPRKVPAALREPLKKELDRLVEEKIIVKVNKPTAWVNSLVMVHKRDNSIRICLDPQDLNKVIMREHFPLPTLEQITSQMAGAKFFSVLDASQGFWQIKLGEGSTDYCTFNTPWGRYKFLRMPYGICSAPEVFHRKFGEVFEGLPGVLTYVDDILCWGSSKQEHDQRLQAVMKRAQDNSVKFNKNKCKIGLKQVHYMGHVFTENGIKPDEEKVAAIHKIDTPSCRKDVERFLGVVTYLSRFIPNLSEVTAPLRVLLKKDVQWHWEHEQVIAFAKLKDVLCNSPVLEYYDVNKSVILSVDASQTGLGAVLIQDGHPVAYASKSLSDTERRYAQIEKEMLAIVFGAERFHQYIYNKQVTVETDHKPLVTIFKKSLVDCPARLQRMLLRLQRYTLLVEYKPGSQMYIPDTLSRACQAQGRTGTDSELERDLELQVCSVVLSSKISDAKLLEIQQCTANDTELQSLCSVISEGWPEKFKCVPPELRHFWTYREDLSCAYGLVLKGNAIVIPKCLRQYILGCIHAAHQGTEKCIQRARGTVFWPGLTSDIVSFVGNCEVCSTFQNSKRRQPLLPHPVPDRPWEKVGIDVFFLNNKPHLLVVDYYSKWVEIKKLKRQTSAYVVKQLKDIFTRLGVPVVVMSDGGSNFTSKEFSDFARDWNFVHKTSSPHYPQSNGMSERHIQTTKKILKKAAADRKDIQVVLLEVHNTPVVNGFSPAQLLMGRRLRSLIPVVPSLLDPFLPDHKEVRRALIDKQVEQKLYYDRGVCQREKGLSGYVRVQTSKGWIKGAKIVRPADRPRSYVIKMPDGRILERSEKVLRVDKAIQNGLSSDDIHITHPLARDGELDTLEIINNVGSHEDSLLDGFRGFPQNEQCGSLEGVCTLEDTNSKQVECRSGPGINRPVDNSCSASVPKTRSGRAVLPPKRYCGPDYV